MFRKALILILIALAAVQCRKDRGHDIDSVSGDAGIQLSFSDQVVLFDTVFTTVGSTTKWLKVYNTSEKAISISRISLNGPGNAHFRMNVDGEAGSSVENVYLAGKDSLFIFVDVTIDPNSGEQLPFIVEGNIEFITNGNTQNVSLIAYGQQAFFITPTTFTENLPPYRIVMSDGRTDTTWQNDLPIVIYGYAVVDEDQHLTIEKGTQIYFHANSGLWVYSKGQITVNGTVDEPVVFQGDRLDDYNDVSGSWDRIWINEGDVNKNNVFDYAIIKHSFIGIQAEYKPFEGYKDGVSANKLILNNTRIENTKFVGLYANNYRIEGKNLLINNSGNSNLLVVGGGEYDFKHSTFANYWRGGGIRNTPAVYLTHLYYDFEEEAYRQDSMTIYFKNSIIYGDRESEFAIEDEIDPGEKINFSMSHTLFSSDIDVSKYGTYSDTIHSPDDEDIFLDPYDNDFHLYPGSRAINFGDNTGIPGDNVLSKDLDQIPRDDKEPDLGVFEVE